MAFFPRLKIVSFQRVFHWQRWELSEDGKFLLIVHDTIQIFRHSSLAKYTIVSLKDRYMQQSFERKIEGIIMYQASRPFSKQNGPKLVFCSHPGSGQTIDGKLIAPLLYLSLLLYSSQN